MKRTFPAPKALRGAARRAAIVALAALAADCSGGGPRLTCPAAAIAPDLDAVALLRPGGSDMRDITAAAKLISATNRCRGETGGIGIDTRIDFLLLRNSSDVKRADFPYFVAVVDSRHNILNEQVFRLDQEYVPRQTSRNVSESITEHLPVGDVSTGSSYFIVIGFKLTPEQLEFNRKQRAQ